jgi:ketosteroid isomerase-like protein
MQPSADDRYSILAAKTQYREAYNSADLDSLIDVFAPEFTDCTDGEPSFYGEEALHALRVRSAKLFRHFQVKMVVMVVEVVVKTDFAYDWGWHKVRLTDKGNGYITDIKYRYYETWRKVRNRWKVDYFITNQELAPRMLNERADIFTASEGKDLT